MSDGKFRFLDRDVGLPYLWGRITAFFVKKEDGKGLSTNDYTYADKAKVDAIPASPKYTDTVYDDTAVKNRLTAVENEVADIGAGSSFSGSYNDLTDKPTIPEAVTEATVSGWGFTKNTGSYSKPTGGIPKTDLASAVQTSLGKADSALQTVPSTYRTAMRLRAKYH